MSTAFDQRACYHLNQYRLESIAWPDDDDDDDDAGFDVPQNCKRCNTSSEKKTHSQESFPD